MTTNAYRRALYGTIIHVSANVVTLLSICLAMWLCSLLKCPTYSWSTV